MRGKMTVPVRTLTFPATCRGQHVEGIEDPAELERRLKDSPLLQPKMKPRHLNMIAVGGSIGTGLFIGSGQALRLGGPAGILIAWIMCESHASA